MEKIELFFGELSVRDRHALIDHCTSKLKIPSGEYDPDSGDPLMGLPIDVYSWLSRYLADNPQATLGDILSLNS